jgi:two-component system, OmpR family, KDP operon response regulator KdpE
MRRASVLVVEDDAVMLGVLSVALKSHGYEVRAAASGGEALTEIRRKLPDAMILDLGLPDMDGFEVAARVRDRSELPIIVLSARGEEYSQIRALDEGANDYVTKPFREGELMARVRVALRRPVDRSVRTQLVVGDVRIDELQQRVFVAEVEVEVTPTEFKLLQLLARHPDQVVTHQQLLREIWGAARVSEMQYLRVYVKQLRQKIEKDPSHPQRIRTALGVGYRLAVPAE